MRIYLASTSPRRKEILVKIIKNFTRISPEIEEKEYLELSTKEKAVRRSKDKCIAGVNLVREKGMVIIASDTVVDFKGKIMDKPKNKAEAYSMISRLSGNSHNVYTAVSVYKDGIMYTFTEKTKVNFNHIPDEEINKYISTDEPYDKAGGYGIQCEFGKQYISNIDGDYYNVMGLPASRLYRMLRELGVIDSGEFEI